VPPAKRVTNVIMVAATQIPTKISGNAFLKGIPKINAARDPVQAPVNGKGIPTNNINATAPYLAYFPANFSWALSIFFFTTDPNNLHSITQPCNFGKKNKINTVGSAFPNTAISHVFTIPNPYTSNPMGIEARNSVMGIIDKKNSAHSGGKLANHSIGFKNSIII